MSVIMKEMGRRISQYHADPRTRRDVVKRLGESTLLKLYRDAIESIPGEETDQLVKIFYDPSEGDYDQGKYKVHATFGISLTQGELETLIEEHGKEEE